MPDEMIVFLEDIAGKMEEANAEWRQFLNIKTGEFLSFQTEYLGIAEDLETDDELAEYSGWERDMIREAADMLANGEDYAELPSQYEIHEYGIMEEFAAATPDPRKQELLLVALNGKGAFRRFKDTLMRAGLENEWYAYRFSAFMNIAKEWCEDNQIAYQTRTKYPNGCLLSPG